MGDILKKLLKLFWELYKFNDRFYGKKNIAIMPVVYILLL